MVGQICNGNIIGDEVDRLVGWCTDNNLTLNVKKTKEIIVDSRRPNEDPPIMTEDLKWDANTKPKAHQHLYFLRTLKKTICLLSLLCPVHFNILYHNMVRQLHR